MCTPYLCRNGAPVCGPPGATTFLLKNCLHPIVENSWICPCFSVLNSAAQHSKIAKRRLAPGADPGGWRARAPLLRKKKKKKKKKEGRRGKERKEKGKEKARHKETKSPSSLLSCLYRPSLTYGGGGRELPPPLTKGKYEKICFFLCIQSFRISFSVVEFNKEIHSL